MRKIDSAERSAELVRQTLLLMKQHGAPMHPIDHAVWYEYARGENLDLRGAIDRHLGHHLQLDEAVTEALYRRHVVGAGHDPAMLQRVSDSASTVLGAVVETAARAGDQTAAYGSSLSRFHEGLSGHDEALPGLAEILATTRQMQGAIQDLQRRLAESRDEIGQLRDELDRVRLEAQTDTLTGLFNRRAFDQRLAACMTLAASAGLQSQAPCLLLLDIDHFKRVNDTHGHVAGDLVLRAVAGVLQATTPEHAMAARIGGEEFVLLLPALQIQAARLLAEQLRQRVQMLRTPIHPGTPAEIQVTASIGLTTLQRGETGAQFVERADQALYQSKSSGRDRITVKLG
ncbi:MAG: diguanylate cyclase [Pseudomonadota bacterium]|nr:diguanylate cyclase [Pseudomonadota bacterium]